MSDKSGVHCRLEFPQGSRRLPFAIERKQRRHYQTPSCSRRLAHAGTKRLTLKRISHRTTRAAAGTNSWNDCFLAGRPQRKPHATIRGLTPTPTMHRTRPPRKRMEPLARRMIPSSQSRTTTSTAWTRPSRSALALARLRAALRGGGRVAGQFIPIVRNAGAATRRPRSRPSFCP